MSKYIKITDTTFIEIQNNVDVYWDDRTYCTVEQLAHENRLNEFSVMVCVEVDKPSFNPLIEKVVSNSFEIVDEILYERWIVLSLTEEEQENVRISNIPSSVSPRQIRQALTRAGLRTSVEAAVASGDQDIKDWWEFATQVERQHPMVITMASSLNITERQLDDLFTLAGTL